MTFTTPYGTIAIQLFIDTAEMYPVYPKKETCGKTEEIIGDWIKIKKNRDKIIIGTKVASNHPQE